MIKVSIILNCFNGEEFLHETLISIKNQSYTDYELIFYDNCSTDKSASIAKTFGEKLKYFRSERTMPLGAARNEALKKSHGDYIAFIDSDDLWGFDKLEKQVKELEENPQCGMVLTNYNRFNMLNGKKDIFYKNTTKKILHFDELVGEYDFCLSSFMIRKLALEGLDHWFNTDFRYAEEFELFSRIAYTWDAVYLADSLVTYRIHGNMNTIKLQDRIGMEYKIALDNLEAMDSKFEIKYPNIKKKILYIIDLSNAKYLIRKGNNSEVRKIMKNHMFYDKRAVCFYLVSLMPKRLSKAVVNLFYRKRI